MADSLKPTTINTWADDDQGPVALHLKQRLLPVEGEGAVIFPPTYADIGYNIDALSDGTKVATIDSVGSQANRMEPIFKYEPYSELIPKIEIELHRKQDGNGRYVERISLLDLAHRSADAVVHASPKLAEIITPAFEALRRRGNAVPLCRIAPTSLIFGFWDSRGPSNEKRPRLVRSIIRAWDAEPLHAAAQFNSVWKVLDGAQQEDLIAEEKTKGTNKRSVVGLADAPAVFRTDRVPHFLHGVANPEARVLGGIRVNGLIEREITVNLVALRLLRGSSDEETRNVRRYLLALTLIAATADIDLYLREGCHLRFADKSDHWTEIYRRGEPKPCEIDWSSEDSRHDLVEYAKSTVRPFKEYWPKPSEDDGYRFDVKEARKLLRKKVEDDGSTD